MPPQLFMYARGDFYYPVASVESYAQAARGNDGDLTFELYDKPNGFDGHQLFSKAFPIVRPTVEQFLSKLGLTKPVGM